jgi:hypothetical protein
MATVAFFNTVNEDESGQQRTLREKIRRAKSGLTEPETRRSRKLYDEDFIDLTAPRRMP